MSVDKYIDIVFDGPPSHESGRFVEVESPPGTGISFGEWVERGDGYWVLRIPDSRAVLAELDEKKKLLRGYCSRHLGQGNQAGCSSCDYEKEYARAGVIARMVEEENDTLRTALTAAGKALSRALTTKHDIRACACSDCEDARAALALFEKAGVDCG